MAYHRCWSCPDSTTLISIVMAHVTLSLKSKHRPTTETIATSTFAGMSDLVVRRLLAGDEIAAAKLLSGRPIVDPGREWHVLLRTRSRAVELELDVRYAERFFQAQLQAGREVQRGLFEKWASKPALAPTSEPVIEDIRSLVDDLDSELVDTLAEIRSVPPKLFGAIDLRVHKIARISSFHLDRLHRRAFATALRTVIC
jgi:chorismate mutase